MGKINVGRVILGGVVAGIVINILGYLVDGILLASQWAAGMAALGKPDFSTNQLVAFNAIGLANGIFMVWLYAAIRPRYGAGPKTAAGAGVAVWVAGTLLPNAALMGTAGLFPVNLTAMTTAAGIVVATLAALAGASVYQESTEAARSMATGA